MAYGDNAPVGHTCPIIDRVINYLDSFRDDYEVPLSEIHYCKDWMEEIRSANSKLRDWGNEQHEEADELQKKLDEAEGRIEQLESELSSVTDERDTYAKELKIAEDEISEYEQAAMERSEYK